VLQSGIGFVSRPVWKIVDAWLRAAESGGWPSQRWITREHRDAWCARRNCRPARLFSGIREEHFANELRSRLLWPRKSRRIHRVCSHLTAGRRRIYDPSEAIAAGILVDSTVRISVRAGGPPSHIEVGWMPRPAKDEPLC